MSETAIRVQNVTKLYKLYDKPSDRFRESLGLTKKYCIANIMHCMILILILKRGMCWNYWDKWFWQINDSQDYYRSSESDKW